ncbi:MAG: HAMP domain-containing sensor histidine kinase [Planctomycetota bacterium]
MRTRRLIPWIVYVVCALAVLEGLGYAAWKALDLQRQGRRDEAARLALWRMDSALTAVLAAESARPYFHYRAFHPAERAYSAMLGPVQPGEVLVPSPLLTEVPPFVKLHFEVDAGGALSSPQAPDGNLRDLAEAEYVASDDVIAAEALRLHLAELLRMPAHSLHRAVDAEAERAPPPEFDRRLDAPERASDADLIARQETAAAAQLGGQRSLAEFSAAEPGEADERADADLRLQSRSRPAPPRVADREQPRVSLGAFSASWLRGDELVLVREVSVGERTLRQGVWLDWPSLRDWLAGQVAGLAPGLTIEPARDATSIDSAGRGLAVIPATLRLPERGSAWRELGTPLGIVLAMTWTAALLAVLAIGVVLRLSTSLAERRGRFVSAVTHELRTPMTTVRLYADLLASDAALDDRRREGFVATLRDESGRLARIIENVLVYARLGRRGHSGNGSRCTVGVLLDRVAAEQRPGVERTGRSLVVRSPVEVRDVVVDADAEAAGRILGNLIENACKYALPAESPTIELVAHADGDRVRISVRDHGPGVPSHERRRIFEPFHRAARDEYTEHGLGLGLALARGLARQMGGTIALDDPDGYEGAGARFTLTLRLATRS